MKRTKRKKTGRNSAERRALDRKASRGWETTDAEEIELRKSRAAAESMDIVNEDPSERFFSTFTVASGTPIVERATVVRAELRG